MNRYLMPQGWYEPAEPGLAHCKEEEITGHFVMTEEEADEWCLLTATYLGEHGELQVTGTCWKGAVDLTVSSEVFRETFGVDDPYNTITQTDVDKMAEWAWELL